MKKAQLTASLFLIVLLASAFSLIFLKANETTNLYKNLFAITDEPFIEDLPIRYEDDLDRQFFLEDTQTIEVIAETASITETGEKTHIIQLPPDYYRTDQNYPVIYFLHGFTFSPDEYRSSFEEAFIRMEIKEYDEAILVAIDHTNSQIGSFMSDSPVIGHWETAFIEEIIPYIDSNYRTIPRRESRAIFGHSMGGIAALNFGMTYPEYFNAIYAFAPNIILDEDLESFINSYMMINKPIGSAFAPNPNAKPPYERPAFDGTKTDDIIIDNWLDGIGHINKKVEAYLKNDDQLVMIGIEIGSKDSYHHFIPGCKKLADVLNANDIPCIFTLTDSPHSISTETVCDRGIPTLLEHLER